MPMVARERGSTGVPRRPVLWALSIRRRPALGCGPAATLSCRAQGEARTHDRQPAPPGVPPSVVVRVDAEGGEVASGGEDESMTTPTSDGHVADAAVDEPTPSAAHIRDAGRAGGRDGGARRGTRHRPRRGTDTRRRAGSLPPRPPPRQRTTSCGTWSPRCAGLPTRPGTPASADLRTRAEEQVRQFEADAERRRNDLRERAEQDVAEVGEWERSEKERIKTEAEQRVVARRSRLDQQLAADTTRTEAETKAIRDRVAEYERELDGYHAQLIEINDPAAFAAAAKRMPAPPSLDGTPAAAPVAIDDARRPGAPVAAPEATPAVTAAADDAGAGGAGCGGVERRSRDGARRASGRGRGPRRSARRARRHPRRRPPPIPSLRRPQRPRRPANPPRPRWSSRAWAASARSPGSGRRSPASMASTPSR